MNDIRNSTAQRSIDSSYTSNLDQNYGVYTGQVTRFLLSPRVIQDALEVQKISADKSTFQLLEVTIDAGMEYYRENKEEIVAKYLGNYIAIVNNSVVDFDADFSKLAERVYGKYGYRPIFMPFAQTIDVPTLIPTL